MGLKDLLFGSGGRPKTKVDKLTKRVTNQYNQSVDRYSAMEDLLKLGASSGDKADKLTPGTEEREKLERESDAAYVGLLKRFTMNASKSIEDEEEKGWLYNRLAAVGKPLLRPIKVFCKDSEAIAWALRLIEDVANEREEWEILDMLLEAHPPEYERDSSAKLQMLTHIKEIEDDRVRDILATYLADPDENVRFFCIDALIDNGEEESKAALVGHLEGQDEDSVRLRSRILDGLADLGWDLSEHAAMIRKYTDDEHRFDGKKLTRS